MFQSLFTVADNLPDPFLWLAAACVIVAGVWLYYGRAVAVAVGGIFASAGVVALFFWLAAAWYAAEPHFVLGLGLGLFIGFLVGSGLLLFVEVKRAPYSEDEP